ncbi:MAG: hypothetical protein ABI809_08030 [Caldimonas sp.]
MKTQTAVYLLVAAASLATAGYQPADAVAENLAQASNRVALDGPLFDDAVAVGAGAMPVALRSTRR